MANHTAASAVTIPLKDLEKLIRRAVHDEITKLMQRQPAFFYVDPQTPLYEDLATIARLKKRGKAKFEQALSKVLDVEPEDYDRI